MLTNVSKKDQVTCVCVVFVNTWKARKYSVAVAMVGCSVPSPGGGSIGGPRHRFNFLLSCVIRAGGPDRGSAGRGDSKKCVLVPGLARLSAGVGLQGLLGSQPA